MNTLVALLIVPASAGVVAYLVTRRVHRAAGWLVWLGFLLVSWLLLRPWYIAQSHCESPATIYVPLVGAFAAASGAWVGITRGRKGTEEYSLVRVALESALMSLAPGVFFVMLLWPCR